MAQGDGAAIDVQPIRINRQLAEAGKHLGGKCLIQLHQTDVVERQPGQLQRLSDRRDGADSEELRRDASGRKAYEPGQRLKASLLGDCSRVTSTAAAPSLVCEEFPAVTVPAV